MKNLDLLLKRYFLSRKGNALVLALSVSVILLIIMLISIVMIRQQIKLVAGSREKSKALSIAEAGLDAVIWRLERNSSIPDETVITGSNTQGSYSVRVDKPEEANGNDFLYRLESTGTHTSTGTKRRITQDAYYINLSRSIFTYSGTNGGGQVEGSVNIWGPFYTSGDLTLSGSVDVYNLTGTSGNPVMVRGDINLNSNGVNIGSEASPVAVFVKGNVTTQQDDQIHNLVSRQVPEVKLPEIVSNQFLDAAQANDNAVYTGNLTLGSSDVRFGQRQDGSYTFDYDGRTGTSYLTAEGVIYIDGDLTMSKETLYSHGSGYSKATIYVNGKITILDDVRSQGTYPSNSVLALVNEDDASETDDIYIDVSGANSKIESFFYCSGQITVNKQVEIEGTVIADVLWLNQVPDLRAPAESVVGNFPYLFPGDDLAFITTTNWREVGLQ